LREANAISRFAAHCEEHDATAATHRRAGTADAKIMGRIARELSDADIEGVVAYFSSLPVRPRMAIAPTRSHRVQ